MNTIRELEKIINDLYGELHMVRTELKRYPKGALMLVRNHGRIQKYMVRYINGKRKVKGIGKDPELVHQLARKAYLLRSQTTILDTIRELKAAGKRITEINTADMTASLPANFEQLPEDYLLQPVLKRTSHTAPCPCTDDSCPIENAALFLRDTSRAEWKSMKYRQNSMFAEQKNTTVPGGLKVRSKSEAGIINIYERYNIPYHYDQLLRFVPESDPSENDGTYTENAFFLSPDIISVRKDGKIIYHEHFGLTDSQDYLNNAQKKLRIYASCRIVPWDNLIVTYDLPGGGIDLDLVISLLKSKGLMD